MALHFPYVAAATITAAVGVVTTAVWAAQAPAHVSAPSWGAAQGALSRPLPVALGPVAQPNLANTPGSAPALPLQPPAGYFVPGNVAQMTGMPGNPAGAQVPGLSQASQFSQPAMNQAGQPPFGEIFYSMQTYMNQPGVQDFYTTNNPAVVQANEGITPSAAYPNPTTPQTPQTGVPSAAAANVGKVIDQGAAATSVGFYRGFGPGQPDYGFYAGFTQAPSVVVNGAPARPVPPAAGPTALGGR